MNQDIHGLWPALLIPVAADGAIGTQRPVNHSQNMLTAGCDGVTLFGTTGEGPAFSVSERKALLQSLLDAAVRPDSSASTRPCSRHEPVTTHGSTCARRFPCWITPRRKPYATGIVRLVARWPTSDFLRETNP